MGWAPLSTTVVCTHLRSPSSFGKMLITWNKNICTLHGPRRRESSLPVCNCINIGPWDISEASMHLCDDFKSHRDHGSGLAAWPPVATRVATSGTTHDRRAVPGVRVRITCAGHAPLIYAEGAVPFILDLSTPGRREHRPKHRRAAHFRHRGAVLHKKGTPLTPHWRLHPPSAALLKSPRCR